MLYTCVFEISLLSAVFLAVAQFKTQRAKELTQQLDHGDEMGRILAYWMIITLAYYFENYSSDPHFWTTFSSIQM
jgi:hypothetical protein